MKPLAILVLVALLLGFASESSLAQATSLPRSVMGAGGVTSKENVANGNKHQGTVGQSITGRRSVIDRKKNIGFWYAARQMMQSVPVAAVVAVPNVEARLNERITIPLVLESSKNLKYLRIKRFEARIRINSTVLQPDPTLNATLVQGEATFTITGNVPDSIGTLGNMSFTVRLGNAPRGFIKIDTVIWFSDANRPVGQIRTFNKDGEVSVIDLCREGDTTRLVKSSYAAGLIKVYPQPAGNLMNVDYELGEKGTTEMFIVDMSGRTAAMLFSRPTVNGVYTHTAYLEDVPNGTYFLMMKTPSEIFSKQILIVK